ncbi:prepilin peptidase [Terriglobus aquaticus]|uniref:Prepilin peptidase n=1 Tax=Terriglobus aquaticus TaxID=940139 RepID=A0ABW9KKC2_9BACT|nr:A24 family peptidase [Terriglobus aquaticus]
MLAEIATLAFALLLGLAFGSFLNVCIARLPSGESVVTPRSHCRSCNAPLRKRDNIPLLSYLLLRGRCHACGAPIPIRYPLVEVATAIWFALSALPLARLLADPASSGDALLASAVHFVAMAVLGFLLIGLAVMDWTDPRPTGYLPNEFTLGGLAAGIFFTFAESFFVPPVAVKTLFTPEEVFIAHRLLAALLGFLVLWLIRTVYRLVRKRPGMGAGDARLLAMMGSFLGLAPLCVAFLVGTGLAAIVGAALLVTRRGTAATPLRYGSFLAVGGLFAALWGDRLATWYLSLFR